MFHCVWDIYSVLGCVFHPGVGGGLKVEGNSKEGRIETTRTKNIGGIVCSMEIPTLSLPSFVCNNCVTII